MKEKKGIVENLLILLLILHQAGDNSSSVSTNLKSLSRKNF